MAASPSLPSNWTRDCHPKVITKDYVFAYWTPSRFSYVICNYVDGFWQNRSLLGCFRDHTFQDMQATPTPLGPAQQKWQLEKWATELYPAMLLRLEQYVGTCHYYGFLQLKNSHEL